jgi:DUF2970 family protein
VSDASSERGSGEAAAGTPRKSSFGRALRAVLWSFVGIRKSKDLERDASELSPLHVVIVGVLIAALFVLALFVLVQWVIRSGVAT